MLALRCLCVGALFTAGLSIPQVNDHVSFITSTRYEEPMPSTNQNLHRTTRDAGACSVTLQDFNKKEPIFIDSKQLVRPDVVENKAVITIPSDKSLLLACPGRNNKNSGTSMQSADLSCSKGKLLLAGLEAFVSNMSCTTSYSGCTTKVTGRSCGGNGLTGVILELGFEISLDKSVMWLPQVELCHDIDSMYTFYSSHKVYGHSLKGAIKDFGRKNFCKGNRQLFNNADVDEMYKKPNQVNSINQFLGKGAGNHYIKTDGGEQYLARGHLTPDADFVYLSEQMLTYSFANVAPQWQKFNNGNWLNKIEKFVRDLAVELDMTLNVYTGTHGVLQLSYQNSGMKNIYLNPPRTNVTIPVPQVFWKMVQNPTTKACTVVVAHNNIFLATPPSPICTTITAPSGWPVYADPIDKGYFYYCDYNSFKTVVSTPDAKCKGVFSA